MSGERIMPGDGNSEIGPVGIEISPDAAEPENKPQIGVAVQEEAPLPKPPEPFIVSSEFDPKNTNYKKTTEGNYTVFTDPQTGKEVARVLSVAGGAASEFGEEKEITVTTDYGGEVKIHWPESKEGSLAKMRSIMLAIERSGQPDGGAGLSRNLHQLEMVVSSLRNNPDEERRSVGNEMISEIQSRLALHSVFLEFSKVSSSDQFNDVVSKLRKEQLNFFLRGMEGVWDAFEYYEANAGEFLRARGIGADVFRSMVSKHVANKLKKKRDESGIESKAIYENILGSSAQIIAERLWNITGRRVVRDELVDGDNPDIKLNLADPQSEKSEDVIKVQQARKAIEKGDMSVAFAGEAVGGNFALRRILKFKDNLYTQIKDLKPQLKLIRGFDLGADDFFGDLPSKLEGYYQATLYGRYKELRGLKNPDFEKKSDDELINKSKEDAKRIASLLSGSEKKKKKDPKTGKDVEEWVKNEKLTGVNWTTDSLVRSLREKRATDDLKFVEDISTVLGTGPQIDFAIFGDTPMSGWSFMKIVRPDAVRKALIDEPDSFLRDPTPESLFKLSGPLAIQWEKKMKLLVNLARFLRKDNYRELRRGNYNKDAVEALIKNASAQKFIEPQSAKETIHEVFRNENKFIKALRNPIIKAILGFLQGFAGGVLKELLNQLKKAIKI